MTRTAKLYLLALIPALAVVVACGSETSLAPEGPSPIVPSRSGTTAASGAVITGWVTGFSGALAAPDRVTTQATTRLTVTIEGTNISTQVDGNGLFMLTGVPPGEVTLKFSGAGGEATITLSNVSATDRITITVTLNGKGAKVESEHRDRPDEVEGVVSNLSGNCPDFTFTLQGPTVKTAATTEFKHGPCAAVVNGARLKVKGERQADGSIKATEVEIKD